MSNASLLYKDPSGAVAAGAGGEGLGGGGVDGHGTHLPYLEGAYDAKAGVFLASGKGGGSGGRRARRYSDGKQGEDRVGMPPCCPGCALQPALVHLSPWHIVSLSTTPARRLTALSLVGTLRQH